MNRYVVMVKPPDDHPGSIRVFGSWLTRAPAETFCNSVRQAVDEVADRSDEVSGYAYVTRLEVPHVRVAKAWALRGESA